MLSWRITWALAVIRVGVPSPSVSDGATDLLSRFTSSRPGTPLSCHKTLRRNAALPSHDEPGESPGADQLISVARRFSLALPNVSSADAPLPRCGTFVCMLT